MVYYSSSSNGNSIGGVSAGGGFRLGGLLGTQQPQQQMPTAIEPEDDSVDPHWQQVVDASLKVGPFNIVNEQMQTIFMQVSRSLHIELFKDGGETEEEKKRRQRFRIDLRNELVAKYGLKNWGGHMRDDA